MISRMHLVCAGCRFRSSDQFWRLGASRYPKTAIPSGQRIESQAEGDSAPQAALLVSTTLFYRLCTGMREAQVVLINPDSERNQLRSPAILPNY